MTRGKRIYHLALEDRLTIEDGILRAKSLSSIAASLEVAVSTVTKEVKRNRVESSSTYKPQKGRNICILKDACEVHGLCQDGCMAACVHCRDNLCNERCPDIIVDRCKRLDQPPYVCNSCPMRLGFGCDKLYLFYDARAAQELCRQRAVQSRLGINIS
jgi:hypothetical protein